MPWRRTTWVQWLHLPISHLQRRGRTSLPKLFWIGSQGRGGPQQRVLCADARVHSRTKNDNKAQAARGCIIMV